MRQLRTSLATPVVAAGIALLAATAIAVGITCIVPKLATSVVTCGFGDLT
jgi:hypothetical protein